MGGGVVTLYDVCHKIATEYEKLFRNDLDWNAFKEKANYLKKQLHCTAGVAFEPPAQRKKVRFHNVDIINLNFGFICLKFNDLVATGNEIAP